MTELDTRARPIQAVILAAGSSTRTLPLTQTRPKPLLPVVNRPLICHTLDQLEELAEEAILVVGYKAEQIQETLGDHYGSLRLRYRFQTERRGTGHALAQARDLIHGPFFLLNGDDLLHRDDLVRLMAHDYAVLGQLVPDPRPFGILELTEEGAVRRILEKPRDYTGRPLASTGAYLFQPQVLELLERLNESERGEIELVDVIAKLPAGACQAVEVGRYWLPVGYPWKLLDANNVLLEQSPQLTRSLPGVRIQGPVLVDASATVEPGCFLGPGTVIGRGCHVGANSELTNCLLMDGVTVGPGCRLQDSVFGERCVLEAEVRTQAQLPGGKTVLSLVNGTPVDTGRQRLGVVAGDGVTLGRGCSTAPGVKIWPHGCIPAGESVQADRFTV